MEISVEKVKKYLNKGDHLNMIDVRELEEVQNGIIPGAKHIPMGDIVQSLAQLDKAKTYVIICRSGNRSGTVTAFLTEHGYQAQNMIGGMLAWEGPVETPPDQAQ